MSKKKVTASAPSQAFLFGEHAVLYGTPALALGVDVRSYSEVTLVEEGVEINSELGTYVRKGDKVITPNQDLQKIDQGIRELLAMLGEKAGLRINIRSEIPVGSGMASSASVAASISKAVSHLLGHELTDQELLEAVYIFERIIHGRASKTGPACAVFGGVIWVEWSSDGMIAQRLTYRDLPLALACTNKPSRTKEMINKVATLRELIPEQFNYVISAIKGLVYQGRKALLEGDLKRLGALMNFNQGLLYALGVSTPELEEIIWSSRESGALGAKISGAGGGGCAVILHEDPSSLKEVLSRKAGRYFIAKVAEEGARIEKEA